MLTCVVFKSKCFIGAPKVMFSKLQFTCQNLTTPIPFPSELQRQDEGQECARLTGLSTRTKKSRSLTDPYVPATLLRARLVTIDPIIVTIASAAGVRIRIPSLTPQKRNSPPAKPSAIEI